MNTLTTTVYLIIAGILLFAIGGGILFSPHAFYGSNDIVLGTESNLLSEIRAPGGLLLCSGIAILVSVFRSSLRQRALTLSVLVYASFGASRLVSMVIDGMPSTSIVGAMLIEIVMGFVGLLILFQPHFTRVANNRIGPVHLRNSG